MMPENALSTEPVQGVFLYPDNVTPRKRIEDFELGGTAIQDPSNGLEVQPWFGYWSALDNRVYLRPNITGTPIDLGIVQANVVEMSFTFDQNMRWVLALLLADDSLKFYWYDTVISGYTISTYTDIYSAKLSLDDKRAKSIQLDTSDVILTYVKNDQSLYTRVQRDRYEIEYLMTIDVPNNYRIINFGMAKNNRLQWRIAGF